MINKQETARKLTGAAGIIMIATLISRITGYLRNILITSKMLPSGYSDEFLMAFTLPDLIYDLLAGGAIAAAMIPILSAYLTKGREKTGWKAVGTFMNLTIVILVIMEVIFFIFTDQLLGVLAAGYNEGTGNKELLVRLTRILLLQAPFMMLAGQLNGILYSYKRFALAAFGPVIYNIFVIISIALFGSKSAELSAWGVVIAAALFFSTQFVASFKHFSNYRAKFFLRSKAFIKLIRVALPSLLSSTIVEINLIIGKSYATYFSKGMLTFLNNANRTWQLPLGIFAQSIGTALLPTLSEQHASESYEEFKSILYKGLRVVYLLSLPTSIIMMILSRDVIRIMFKWGGVTEYEVFYGGLCLLAYSAALVFASVGALMTRAFYSIHDSKTPVISGLVQTACNYILNAFFINFTNIGIAGPALSYSISSFVNMMIIVLAFKRKTGIDIIADNFGYVFKSLGAVIPAGLTSFVLSFLIRPDVESKISQLLVIVLPMAAGLGLFWLTLRKLKIPEVEYINGLVMSKIKRR